MSVGTHEDSGRCETWLPGNSFKSLLLSSEPDTLQLLSGCLIIQPFGRTACCVEMGQKFCPISFYFCLGRVDSGSSSDISSQSAHAINGNPQISDRRTFFYLVSPFFPTVHSASHLSTRFACATKTPMPSSSLMSSRLPQARHPKAGETLQFSTPPVPRFPRPRVHFVSGF